MPAAIIWAANALATYGAISVGTAVAIGTFAATYGSFVLLVGGLAYSSIKAKQAASAARDQYNAAQVDRLVNVMATTAPRELVMGRVRKAGTIFYRSSTGANSKELYLAIALAGHESDAIEEIYLNDDLVTLDGSGNVTNAPYAITSKTNATISTGDGYTATLPSTYIPGSAYGFVVTSVAGGGDHVWSDDITAPVTLTISGLTVTSPQTNTTIHYQHTDGTSNVKITKHLGEPGQTVDADLLAAFPDDWSSSNTVDGITYLVVKLTYSEASFPSGAPNVTVVMRGAKLLDPRTGLTVWSENPALMMRHVYQHAKFGKATITASEDARIIAAANACDQSVNYTVDGVATANQLYRASIVLPFGAEPKSAFDDLAQAMGGSWAFAGGALYVKPGTYSASVMSLTDADLAVIKRDGASETQVPISISVHKERAQKFNTVKVKIWDQAQDYKQVSLTPLVGSALLTRDGMELVQEVTFPAVGYAPQALHIAGVMMRDARDALVVDLPFKLRAYPLELFDTVDLTLSRYGWTNKTFTILSRTWTADGSIQLTLKETTAAITQMDSGFLPQGFAANTNLPQPWVVAGVGPLTVTASTITQKDSTVTSTMTVAWPQVADMAVVQAGKVEVQYRSASSTGAWTSLIVPGDETQVTTSEVIDGAYYIVRARAKTTLGIGDWSAHAQVHVTGKVIAPLAPTATAAGGMFMVDVAWTFGNTATDIRGTEIWWSATNDRATASRLSFEPFPATAYSHIGLSAGQGGYYWLRVSNSSELLSEWYPLSATAGIYAAASADASALLLQLQNQIGLTELAAELATPITATLPAGINTNALVYLDNALMDYDMSNRIAFQEAVTNATIYQDPITGQISLLATAAVTTDIESRLSTAEVTLNADHAAIDLATASVAQVGNDLTTAQSQITALQSTVSVGASQVYVDNAITGATGALTVTAANSALALANTAIQEALDAFTQGRALDTMTANVATAQERIDAQATALASEVTSRSALVATTAQNGAAILDEANTRTTAVSALASRATALEATVNSPTTGVATKASVGYVDTAKADAISAAATTTALVQAQLNTGGATQVAIAAAQSTANTAVDNAGAAASTANTVLARLEPGGDYAAVKEESSTSVSRLGTIEAKHVLKVDANGHVAGMELISNGAVSSIAMLADQFLWVLPDGAGGFTTPQQAMILTLVNGVPTLGINGNLIVKGSIIAGTATSIESSPTPVYDYSYAAGGFSSHTLNGSDICTLISEGKPTLILGTINTILTAQSNAYQFGVYSTLYIDGVATTAVAHDQGVPWNYNYPPSGYGGTYQRLVSSLPLQFRFTPSAGSHSYKIVTKFQGLSTFDAGLGVSIDATSKFEQSASLIVMENKI